MSMDLFRRAARRAYTEPYPMSQAWSIEDELLKNFRLFVLRHCEGSRMQTARILGLSLRGLRVNLKRYRDRGEYVPNATLKGNGGNSVQLDEEFWEKLNKWIKGEIT